jgi:hypothetical protein
MNVPKRVLVPIGVVVVVLALGASAGFAQDATPAGGDQMMAHHPAHIHQGSCAEPSPDPAYTLSEIGMNMEEHEAGPAIGVEISVTTVDATLADLLVRPSAIDVHEVKELGEAFAAPIACGDLGGQPTGDVLAVGIHEVDASGFSGIAVLQAAGDKTTVTLYMAHGLSGQMGDEMAPEATP